MMSDILVTGHTLIIYFPTEIGPMSNKGIIRRHRCFFQVGVAGQATGIVCIGLAVRPLGLPVDILQVAKVLDIEIMDACTPLCNYIVERTVVG
jgi:hypothetical protein